MHFPSMRLVCLFGLTTLFVTNSGFAQEAEQPAAPVVENSTNCFSTFAIGTITYCVSEHGNVVRFTSPAAAPEHIRLGVIREGYALCSAASAVAAPSVSYDAGSAEAGWQAAVTIVQPVPNALPLSITRTTTTGIQLTQTFSHNANDKEVLITMTIRNLSATATRFNVRLDRYFDGDINGTAGTDRYSRSADAVWAEDGPHVLSLRDNNSGVAHTTAVHTFAAMVVNTCNQATIATPTALGDFAGRISYSFGNLLPNQSRTVRVQYDKM